MARLIVPAPYAGIDWSSPAGYGLKAGAADMVNFLPGTPGKLRLRGPATSRMTPTGATIVGGIIGNTSADSILVQVGTTLYAYTVLASGLSNGGNFAWPAGAGAALGSWLDPAWSQLGSLTYFYPRQGFGRRLFQWAGGGSGSSLIELSAGPGQAQDIATHLNRLFVVNASPPSVGALGAVEQYSLFWTDPGWDGTSLLMYWQDDVSGLINKLDLGVFGGIPRRIVSWNDRLYILRGESIQMLVGSAPSNWQLKTVANIGIRDDDSVAVTDEGIYFFSTSGFVLFDGVSPRVVSDPVTPLHFASSWSTWTTPGGYLVIRAGVTTAGGNGGQNSVFLYHRASGAWGRVDGNSGLTSFVSQGLGFDDRLFVKDSVNIVDWSFMGQPDRAQSLDLKLGKDNGTSRYIGVARSRPIMTSNPGQTAVVRRLRARGLLTYSAGTVPNLSVSLIDKDQTTSLASASANGIAPTTLGTLAAQAIPQTLREDVFAEIADQAFVQWQLDPSSDSATVIKEAEVYDAELEWEGAQPQYGLT